MSTAEDDKKLDIGNAKIDYTDDMTEEEKAALLLSDDDEEESSSNDTPPDTKTTDDKPAVDDDAAAAKAEPAAAAGRDDGGDDEPVVAREVSRQAPLLVAEAPADADERLAKIAQDKTDLMAKFDDGDITVREYQTQMDALAKEEREIERAVDTAKIASNMEEQRRMNDWIETCDRFIDENSVYKEKASLHALLDMNVRKIGSDPTNSNLNGRQILEKAHQMIVDDGLIPAKAAAKAEDKKPEKDVTKGLPPDLSKVPAAAQTDAADGRWTKLDQLMESNYEAYEDALMKLSESDREAYMSR